MTDGARTSGFDPFAGPAILRTAPSTEPQREIWTATRISLEASLGFNESFTLRFVGPLDIETLRESLSSLITRHEALRTTFSGDGLTLCVAASLDLAAPLIDYSPLDVRARETSWHQLLARAVEEPFDLERGPLVRVTLVRWGPEEHRAIFTAHHIICDGWSTGVLIREWASIYSGATRKVPANLPPVESFSAYARSQAQQITSPEHEEAERYWLGQFGSEIPVLDLPSDRPRPTLKTYSSRREDLTLEAAFVKRLKQAGAKERASLFTLLLAGFKALVYRLTAQEDLVVGIPTAGQSVDGHHNLVGHCVHLLPLRSQIGGAQPFRDLLTRLRSTTLDAIEHQAFTFGGLLERLPLRRDPSRLPLVSVIFNLDRGITAETLAFEGLDVEFTTNPRSFENFDLFLNAVESDSGVALECQYNTDLFDVATVRSWLASYRLLLEAILEDMSCQIGRLPIVSAADLQALAAWNDTSADFPRVCVHHLVEAQVKRTPDAVAVEYDGRTISYSELDRQADQLARRLRAAGIGGNGLVGLCIERSIEMVVGLLAVLKAGYGYVPLDPDYPVDRIAFMVRDSGMSVLLTERKVREKLPLEVARVVYVEDAEEVETGGRDTPVDSSAADPESVAYVIYTSGSTGKPKGVLVPHRSVVNLLTSVRQRPGMTATDVVLAITTLSFDIAVSELLLPLSVGARIVIASREIAADGVRLLQLLRDARVTFVDATPASWRLLIDAGWNGGEGLNAICTGEALPRDLAVQLAARAAQAWNGYGPTETTVWSTFHQITLPIERVLIGKPIANTQIHILDEWMQPVPIGVAGELYIGGAGVTLGYLNRPDLTEQRFVPDPFSRSPESRLYRTGDVARYLRSGEIECFGRNDDQVKLRGFRIELGEIEDVLSKHEAIGRAAVVAREDRPGDRRLVAYVVLGPGRVASEAELKAHVQRTLPSHMIPSVFVVLNALPLTPSGKVDRRNLPEPSADRVVARESFVAPRTPTEKMLAELWQQSLRVGRVSIHDDFFALGGHSLLASQLLARLRRDHGVDILFRRLFEAPTVAGFAEIVDAQPSNREVDGWTIQRRPENTRERLSIAQERIWLLEIMDPQHRIAHNLPAAWRLTGPLDLDRLEKAVNAIVARHETLRTSVHVENGVPFQNVAPALTLSITHLDLSGQAESERSATMLAYFDQETRRPYDLAVPPLFRAVLARLGEEDHVLFILPHALIWDGWSFDLFLRELGATWDALSEGQPVTPSQLPISYRDFAAWQREWLDSPASDRQKAWWLARLGGDLPVLELPLDHGRPTEPTRAGANIEIHLSRAETDALMAIARDAGGTLFTVLFAAFCVLLHRLTGQDDVVVGTPVRARTRPEIEDVIGPFMNMLVLRSQMNPDTPFAEFHARVRDGALDSLGHQEVPLEVVGIRPPILRAFFSLQDARSRPLGFGNLTARQLHILPPTSAADVMLWSMETQNGLLAMLNYSSELFDAVTMERFLARFRTLLFAIARDPRVRVDQLQLMPEEERARLNDLTIAGADNTPADIRDLIDRQILRSPSATAIVHESETVDYAELSRRVNRIAAELRRLGVGPTENVAAYFERSIDLVTAVLAVIDVGATWVILDPGDPVNRLEAILENAGIRVLLTTDRRSAAALTGATQIVCLDELASTTGAAPPFQRAPRSLEDIACLLHTWEGDGRPRVSRLSYRRLSGLIEALTRETSLTSDDIILAVSPPSLDISILELLAPLAVGARVVLAGRDETLDSESLADAAVKSEATLMFAPAATWSGMLESDSRTWPALKAICVGELPTTDLVDDLLSRTAGAWVAYGFPQAGIWSTLARRTESDPPGLLGRPLPGARVRIFDRNLEDAPLGVVGELCIGLPGEPLFRSGERARWRSDDTIELVEVRAGQISSEGFRIELDEISAALRHHAAVEDAAVAVDANAGRKRLVAYVVRRAGLACTDTELRLELRRTLPERAIPRAFVEVADLPRSRSGKLDRDRLGNPERSSPDHYVAPGNETEILVARLWREVLGLDRVGIHDNFFELGGYSLLCFQLLDRIEHETGQRLSPRLLLVDSLQQVAAQLQRMVAEGGKQPAPKGASGTGVLHRLGKLLPGSA